MDGRPKQQADLGQDGEVVQQQMMVVFRQSTTRGCDLELAGAATVEPQPTHPPAPQRPALDLVSTT
jgi:hypothetical protein